VARHGCAADAPFIGHHGTLDTTTRKRFGIESSYRLFEQAIATTFPSTVRLLYVVVSLLLQNVWRYLHYGMWRRPPRGRRLSWPYKGSSI